MEKTVAEIAGLVGGEVVGDGSMPITGFSGLKEAQPGQISFLANKKYASLLQETKASVVLVSNREQYQADVALIKVENPSMAFSKLLSLFIQEKPQTFLGIHPTAVIAKTAKIAQDVNIGPYAVIEDGVQIGNRSSIGAGSFIGFRSAIGDDCVIYANVSIQHQSVLGNRVVIHSGTVVGSDGFGYVTEQGVHEKIPQIGIVEIRDDVEIGANVTIDRARFDKTLIGPGTKIDNLVQIAHNVQMGKGCIIVSQVGISGSTIIEDYVVLGGQVGVAGHITVGAGSMAAAQSGIASSVEPKSIVLGSPAQPHMKAKRANAAVNKLPDYLKVIRELQEKVKDLEKKLSERS